MSGPRPATPEDVARVHLRFDSLFTRPSLQEHTRGNPGLCWVNDHDEYVVGGRWKARREIAEVLELSGPGRGLRGLLPASRADTHWPERRAALVEALAAACHQQGGGLVLASEREIDRHLPLYRALHFHPVEDIVYYRKPDAAAPRPTARLELQPLNWDTIDAVMALEQRVFPWLWWYGEDEWYMISMLSGVETFLAYLDGRLVGYETHTVHGLHGHLDRIGVDPALQGQGYGEELLLRAVRRIAALGGRDVGLSTQRANARARRLYEKHGFRDTTRGTRYYGRLLDPAAAVRLDPLPG